MTMRNTLCALVAVPILFAAGCSKAPSEPKTVEQYMAEATVLPYDGGTKKLSFQRDRDNLFKPVIQMSYSNLGEPSKIACFYTPGNRNLCEEKDNPTEITPSEFDNLTYTLNEHARFEYQIDKIEGRVGK